MTITMSGTKKIYVCSALRGDVENNIEKAKAYCAYLVKEHGAIPVAPHIYFTQFLDDNIPEEREFGMNAGLSLLSGCDELWYFGDSVSEGMRNEICYATEHGIPVRFVPSHYYESYLERSNTYEEIL